MSEQSSLSSPAVPFWQVTALRFFYLLIAVVMGGMIWSELIFADADVQPMRAVVQAMLAALSLLCLLGLRYPLKMLPLLFFEMGWKTIWISFFAYPAWASGAVTAQIEGLFWECIPVAIMYLIMPWRYIWHHYVHAPTEAWRKTRTSG